MKIAYYQLMAILPKIATGLIIFFIAWWLGCLTKKAIVYCASQSENQTYLYRVIGQIAKIAIMVLGAVIALGTMGVNVSALVASLGLVGFALGFALRDTLSNLISGFIILFYKPFTVGDHIAVSDVEGEVIDINIRYTVVKTDSQQTHVPNATMMNNPVTLKQKVK